MSDSDFKSDFTEEPIDDLPEVKTAFLLSLFNPEENAPVFDKVQVKPKSDSPYLFQWKTQAEKKDFRADRHSFYGNGMSKSKAEGKPVKRLYFKLRVADNEYSKAFKKHACFGGKYPHQVLIYYQGDSSVCVPFVYGNAKAVRTCLFYQACAYGTVSYSKAQGCYRET